MPKRLYVHIGPPKTGTTTIQGILKHHDNSVIIYPKVGMLGGGAHHNMVWNFRGVRGAKGQSAATGPEQIFEAVAQSAKQSDLNVLISSEALWPVRRDGRRLTEKLEAFIRAAMPYVGRDTPEVEILVACREHFERAASYYSQKNKKTVRNAAAEDPDEFLATFAPNLCYAARLRRIRETGFKVTPLNYHPKEDWVKRFLVHVGFSESQIPLYRAKNLSLSPKALIAKLAANQVVQSNEEINVFLESMKKFDGFYSPSQFIFGQRAAELADRVFSEDRRVLLEEYGIRLEPPNLSNQENRFHLDTAALTQIETAARVLGKKAALVVRAASEYLKN